MALICSAVKADLASFCLCSWFMLSMLVNCFYCRGGAGYSVAVFYWELMINKERA